jgi:hypothetical protein
MDLIALSAILAGVYVIQRSGSGELRIKQNRQMAETVQKT